MPAAVPLNVMGRVRRLVDAWLALDLPMPAAPRRQALIAVSGAPSQRLPPIRLGMEPLATPAAVPLNVMEVVPRLVDAWLALAPPMPAG
jgi:hypothetical protein